MDFMPPELANQRWAYITQDMVPGVYDYYMISDQGLVWNRRECRLMSQTPASSSYLAVNLSGEFGPKTTMVHRLVAMAFVYNPEPLIRKVVNHIDGNKFNNWAYNLEWVTAQQNTQHAMSLGLFNPKNCSKMTIDTRDEIRRLLSLKKYSCREIAEMTGVSKSLVSHIRYGETWSDENSVESYSIRNRIDENDVKKICEYFENYKEDYSTAHMNNALAYANIEINANYRKIAKNIFDRKNYKHISKNYNF